MYSPSSGYSSASSPSSRQHLPSLMDLPLTPPPTYSNPCLPSLMNLHMPAKMLLGHQSRIKCPISGAPLVTIMVPNGTSQVWSYEPNRQKPVPHECPCLEFKTLEAWLHPLYSVFDGNEYVVFAENLKAQKVEQFTFAPGTGGLVRVCRPEVAYRKGKEDHFITIGGNKEFIQKNGDSWEKKRFTERGWQKIPAIPIENEASNDSEEVPKRVTKCPQLMVVSCSHRKQDLLIFKTLKAGKLCVYRFDALSQNFKGSECFKCFPKDLHKHRNVAKAKEAEPKSENEIEAPKETPKRDFAKVLRVRRDNKSA